MGEKATCKAEGCDKDVRGKGYCDRHYRAWKRGKMPKARYTRCGTAGCTKPIARRNLCDDHFRAKHAKAEGEASGGTQGGAGESGGAEAAG